MKRIVFFLFISIIFRTNVYSQYDKGKFYFESNILFNYDKNILNVLGDKTTKSVLNSDVGYLVFRNFVVGAGFNNNYTRSAATIQGLKGTCNGVPITDEHITNTRTMNGFYPAVFVKYIYPFSSRLSVSLMLRSLAGKTKEKVTMQYLDVLYGTGSPTVTLSETGKYSETSLSPEIRYSLTKHLGLQINFSGYEISFSPKENTMFDYNSFRGYYLKTPITYEKSERINLSPKNWSFGVFVVI